VRRVPLPCDVPARQLGFAIMISEVAKRAVGRVKNVLKSLQASALNTNRALRAQLANVGLELKAEREQSAALRAQLISSEELNAAREQLNAFRERGRREETVDVARCRYRQSLVLLLRLLDLLPREDGFVIVNGGARAVDGDPRWRPFPPERMRFVGFEPDKATARRLNSMPGPGGFNWQFIPAALWGTSGQMRFEHNRAAAGSSFLPQNRELTDRWKFESPTGTALARDTLFPVSQEDVHVIGLVDWAKEAGVDAIDFLTLNVRGGELEILQGAGGLLDSVLGILVEVSFVESYRDRPLFWDVDRYLADRGLAFFDLLAHHYVGRSASPIAAQQLIVFEPKLGQLVSSWGQLIEGHALYFRDPLARPSARRIDAPRVIKLAALAEAFGQVEYAFELLGWLATRADVLETSLATKLQNVIAEGSAKYEQLAIFKFRSDATA
jgi:FkbM family methyltransferase